MRFAELSPIPRTVSQFFTRYQDRILYGPAMNPDPEMHRVTFRLLETADEHFYPAYFRKYHWPMHAWAPPDGVLKNIYRENALRILSALRPGRQCGRSSQRRATVEATEWTIF